MSAKQRPGIDQQSRNQILLKIRSESEASFDRLIIYLNAGGLALSIAFIQDVVIVDQCGYKGFLVASWFCYLIGLIATLVSFRTAVNSIDLELSGKHVQSDKLNKRTNQLNNTTVCLFIFGTLTLVLFILTNLL